MKGKNWTLSWPYSKWYRSWYLLSGQSSESKMIEISLPDSPETDFGFITQNYRHLNIYQPIRNCTVMPHGILCQDQSRWPIKQLMTGPELRQPVQRNFSAASRKNAWLIRQALRCWNTLPYLLLPVFRRLTGVCEGRLSCSLLCISGTSKAWPFIRGIGLLISRWISFNNIFSW